MAVGQNQWYHFGLGAPPILVYFSGDGDVHWGYGVLTHGHIVQQALPEGPEIESQQFSFESLPDGRFSQRSRGSLRIASAIEMNRGEAGCSQVDLADVNCSLSEFLAFRRFFLDHVSGQPKVATSGRSTTEVRGQALVNRW